MNFPARCSLTDSAIAHYGTVQFEDGAYARAAGSDGWTVQPIARFGLAVGPRLGQVRITFRQAMERPYAVVATAVRLPTTPSLYANCGDLDGSGFVVHLFDPIREQDAAKRQFFVRGLV